jgi:uncharacterized protein (TIGR03382 family)
VKPALKGRGRVGEIDPVTGKPWPPSDADPEDVNSFADMGRTGGGGGGGAAAKSAAAGTAVNVADGEAKSGGGGGDRGGDWRAAVLDVVVSASSSATSAAAKVDAPQLNVGVTLGRAGPLAFYHAADHGDSGQVSFIYVGGQIWGVQRFVIVSAGDRVSRIVTVGEDGKVAPVEGDVAVVGTVIDASALLAQLSDWLDSGNQAAETALRKEFPTGINWDDPKELVALQSLLTQITAPSSSPPISVGHLNATAVPEPAGICLALVGLAMGLGRRRRR